MTSQTINEIIQHAINIFKQNQIESPRQNAEQLLEYILKCNRTTLYAQSNQIVDPAHLNQFNALLQERLTGKPLQYILGEVSFYTIKLKVTPNVLIPRPETEILVEAVIERIDVKKIAQIADIGTGSGAIATALAVNLPLIQVIATDISEKALIIARQNAIKNGVADRIHFQHGDLLTPLKNMKNLNAIISNPPYVAEEDRQTLPIEVRDFEPEIALFAKESGTYYHQILIKESWEFLKPGGWLIMEMGIGQGNELSRIAHQTGQYSAPVIIRDYAGIERVFILEKV